MVGGVGFDDDVESERGLLQHYETQSRDIAAPASCFLSRSVIRRTTPASFRSLDFLDGRNRHTGTGIRLLAFTPVLIAPSTSPASLWSVASVPWDLAVNRSVAPIQRGRFRWPCVSQPPLGFSSSGLVHARSPRTKATEAFPARLAPGPCRGWERVVGAVASRKPGQGPHQICNGWVGKCLGVTINVIC